VSVPDGYGTNAGLACYQWTSFIPTLFEMYRKIENNPKEL
jgi:hypothetical protein